MRRTPPEILASVRARVIRELLGRRGGIDHVYHGISDDELRSVFDVLLGKLSAYLGDRDPRAFRSYLRRWVTMRVGSGARHENLIPALVAVGDTVIEAAQDELGDTDEVRRLMRMVAQANFVAARVVVEVLADEYQRRRAQLDTLGDPDV